MLPAAGGAPLFLIHHPSLQTPLHFKHSPKSPSAAAFISSAAISGSIDLVIRSSAPSRSSKGGKVARALCFSGPGLWCCPEAGSGWDLLGSSLWGVPSQSVPVVEGPSPTGIISLQEVPRTQLSLSPLAPSQPASKPCGNLPEFSLLLGFLLPALAQGLWVLQSLPLEHPWGISWLGLPNTCKFPLVLH